MNHVGQINNICINFEWRMLADDQLRFILGMLIQIPLSYCLRYLKDIKHREIYSIVTGTLVQFYVYGFDVFFVFGLHALVYVICGFKLRFLGKIVTFLSMILLSIYHIYRMWVDYGGWVMDISTIMMTMVCKYSEFAYAIQDGRTNP